MTDWADEKAREVLNDLQLFPWSQVHLDIIATALRAAVEAERERCAGIPNVILTNHPPGPVRDALAEVRDAIAQGAPPWTPADFTKAAVEAERSDHENTAREVMVAVPAGDPLMVAWSAYKATDAFQNSKRWAAHAEHVDGSLWAAFEFGFRKAYEEIPWLLKELDEKQGETTAAVEAERAACLGICDKIIAEPVLRDGSKAKHLRIRDAIAARKAP